MPSSTTMLKAQFDLNTRLYINALAGITDTEANNRNNEHANHMKWIAGHLLNTRIEAMSNMTGGTADTSYSAIFGRGTKLDPDATYPPIDELTAKWTAAADAISQGLTHIPDEVLGGPAPVQTPIPDETFLGMLAFFVSHETYHIGQLGILRKMAGKESMSYR